MQHVSKASMGFGPPFDGGEPGPQYLPYRIPIIGIGGTKKSAARPEASKKISGLSVTYRYRLLSPAIIYNGILLHPSSQRRRQIPVAEVVQPAEVVEARVAPALVQVDPAKVARAVRPRACHGPGGR